ncbi:Cysteine-tRNA ligase [Penicillium griseofulvum]|uniref:cysteine--tRNA ligase n=1 Tax=Penicillium patulum TaxID=5078 RepID=A0A135LMD0_PENPA|nr:Cysteine-tRNA ligase [Penicillium griseofulvum]KXG50113.1 Cysteine-tRNA ligase [Penicillium griseofulvum]
MSSRQQPPWRQPAVSPDAQLPPLKVWNSLTKSKTPFVPIDPAGKKVVWYACGPTVYDDAHLGHARNYVSTDIIRRIMRDYFKFDVNFVMNITDVDDKIILRARQQHLFNEFIAANPSITPEVLDTVKSAFVAYLKKNLPLLESELPPSQYQKEVEKTYATILNGGALPGNEKAGDDEAKVKMHIKTAASAAKVIAEAETRTGSSADPALFAESFYSNAQDLILPYLDSLKGALVDADDHSIFTKLTKRYEERFIKDMRDLNVLDPTELTRVTEYGDEIAAFVDRIVKNNFGYVTKDGSVYFDINAFEAAGHPYARLEPWSRSDNKLAAEGEGSLASKTTEKRGPSDFALWKSSKPGEPSWSSNWGKGRPGWHIECSAMASARLGNQMDIHSGGIDLAFPHHDNELAQSEAYWHDDHKHEQWVNYFLHMGHLSIQGSKMSKSLKNFTTIREALDRKDWSPRSLRIVFLLGGWKDGVEITEDLVNVGSSWEEKVNNFFLKVKDPAALQSSGTDTTFAVDLEAAKKAVNDQLCDSFNTPAVMATISELISKFNIVDKATVPSDVVQAAGQWVTSMVNIFGLNGTASADSTEIGWSGIDIPEEAKAYLYPLSAMRDTLREAARSKAGISAKDLEAAVAKASAPQEASESAKPYAEVFSNFRAKVTSLESSDSIGKDILSLCDRVRDIDLFDIGIALEDRENQPALVRPVTQEMLKAREEKETRALQKQAEKLKKEQEALKKAEKGKLSHLEMFRTSEYTAWDDEGMPTRDNAGEEITKSRAKKLRKEWERQKKAHEAWLATQAK